MICLVLPLAECAPADFLPESGPTRGAVLDGAQYRTVHTAPGDNLSYALVTLDETTVTRLPPDNLGHLDFPLTGIGRADGRVGVGDMLSITIFESDSGGLFLPREPGTRPGNYVTLPTQQVDLAGNITVPFAGAVHVTGRTPAVIQNAIRDRLADRALEPQVIVSVADRRADPVTVLGEVTTSTHFALDPGGERLLGAIARAGGPRFPAFESVVTVQRDGKAEHILLADVALDPQQNVQIQPGDSIYVAHEPRYFLALGATGTGSSIGQLSRRIPFSDARISLADALAAAGGLQDALAFAKAVFVYRYEPRATLLALGLAPDATLPPQVPTVYALDVADPAGFFYSRRFPMRSEDVVFVSNAPATDISKFLSLLLPTANSALDVRGTTP